MSNLAIVNKAPLGRVISNHMEAAFVVGITSYLVGCVLIYHDEKEFSKNELLAEVISAGYAVWKWKMGLGPEPPVNTGVPNEVSRCQALESRGFYCSQG